MLLPRRILALIAGASTIGFVACAQDAGLEEGSGGGGSGGGKLDGGGDAGAAATDGGGGISGNDGGWPTGGFGSPCKTKKDCASGDCVDIGEVKPNLVCTIPCTAGKACPAGGYCAFHPDKGYLCIPDVGNQCAKCVVDADCPSIGDRCTPSPNVDRFCARDCSFDGQCPTGFTCVDPSGYPPGMPPPPVDGGAPEAGVGEAGAPTKPAKMCVPQNGESCACDTKRDGVKRKCTQQSGSVICEGTETCNGAAKKWEGCTASSPKPETCDGADNDCNGTPDDGTPATLCASQGTPAHAQWACNFGACEIGSCDAGWAAYPPGLPPAQGCTCQVDSKEPNDTCATAAAAGSVSDGSATALNFSGTLSGDAEVDWWKFDTVDADEGATNSYHIKIVFSAPATNNEFVFDVIRGSTCGTPDAKHSDLATYDWCVDGTGTVGGNTVGEKTCGPTAPIHCGPHNKSYFVRVKRKSGATPSCAQYTLTVTAKGTGTCDFTQNCDPQISEI